MYNTQIHTVQAMRRSFNEPKTIQQMAEETVNEMFKPFKYDAQEIYTWANREFSLNAEKAKATMLYLKQVDRALFDAVMELAKPAIETFKATQASAPVTPAPVEVATTSPKAVPATTYEQAQKYGATPYTCGCPDRAARNGSYTGLDGRPACKHMYFHQKYYTDIAI